MQKNGKTIWITGASSGIGEACAYLWAKEKANLILTATREERLIEVQESVHSAWGHGARCYPTTSPTLTGIDGLTDRAIGLFGSIDILFLNAGISQRARALDTDDSVDEKIMDVNFFAPIKIAKQLLPAMIAKGGGTVAVTSSISGKFGFPLRSAYASSKFALVRLFRNPPRRILRPKHPGGDGLPRPGNTTHISYNSLRGDGQKHGRMDDGQAGGISSEKGRTRKSCGLSTPPKAGGVRRREGAPNGVHQAVPSPRLARRIVSGKSRQLKS
jgi:dehydrogenase/reductase SDR family protein 7B